MPTPVVFRTLVWALTLCTAPLGGQCLTPELAVINSCIEHPNPNGSDLPVESEILVVSSGLLPIPVADIGIDVPFNGFGANNGDVGVDISGNPLGCSFTEPTVTALPGCDNVIPLGPADTIPAGAIVVFFTTATTVTEDINEVDFSNICPQGEPIYVLQNACERTAGAFANGGGAAGDPLRTITLISDCGLRGFTYSVTGLDPEDGTYYLVGLNEIGNLNCDLPVIPETCPAIDTVFFVCDSTGALPVVAATELAALYPEDVLAVSFHASPADAEQNRNRITAYQTTAATFDTLYARIINSFNFCIAVGEMVIAYQSGSAMTMPPAGPLVGCDTNGNGTGTFDLRRADAAIGNGQPVTYFTDAAGTQRIGDPTAFQAAAGTIFARAGLGSCAGELIAVELVLAAGPQVMASVTETSCAANADGIVSLATSGNAPFTYTWTADTLPETAEQSQLPAASYGWRVTDANGCTAAGVATVPTGETVSVACTVAAGASDSTSADGSIGLSIDAGRPPFLVQYAGAAAGAVLWTETSGELTGLPAGNYLISVTDTDGCISAGCPTIIGLTDPVLLDCSVRNQSNGSTVLGSISAVIDGGVEPFTVTISAASGGSSTLPNEDRGEVIFSNLPAGDYTIVVTDAAGQTASCAQTIGVDSCPLEVVNVRLLVADCTGGDNSIISLEIAGFEGTIATSWSGGNNIGIFDGLNEAGPLPPGTYFAEVSDDSGCPPVMVGPIEVEDRGLIELAPPGITPSAACAPTGVVTLVPTGGGTPPYRVVLTDADGDELDAMTVAAGDTARFSGLAGTDGGTPNYAYTVTDALGCAINPGTLTVPAAPAPVLGLPTVLQVIQPPTCFDGTDGSFVLSASGGTPPYAYDWIESPPLAPGRVLASGPEQTDLPAGAYRVVVTEAGGCRDTFDLTLPAGARPTVACGPTTPAVGTTPGTVTLTLTTDRPPLQLTILEPGGQATIFTDLPAGDTLLTLPAPGEYLAFGFDDASCPSDTCLFTIGETACAVTLAAQTDPVDCTASGRIVVQPAGGNPPFTFAWSDPTLPPRDTVYPLAAGNYVVTVTDANGCTATAELAVDTLVNAPRVGEDTLTILSSCTGDSVSVPLELFGTAPFRLDYFVTNGPNVVTTDQQSFIGSGDTLRLPVAWFAGAGGAVTLTRLIDARCSASLGVSGFLELPRPDTIRRFEQTCRPEGVTIGGRLFTAEMPSDTFTVADGSECGQLFYVDLTFLAPEVPDTMEVFLCAGDQFVVPETGDVFNDARPEGEVAYPREGECDSLVYVRLDVPEVFVGSFSATACGGDTVFVGEDFFTVDRPSGLATLPDQAASGCDSLIAVAVNFRRVGELRLLGDHAVCPGDSVELRFAYDGQGRVAARLENLQGEILDVDVGDGDRVTVLPDASTAWSIVSVQVGNCPGRFTGRSVIEVSDFAIAVDILTDPGDFCQDTLGRTLALPSGGSEPYTISWSNGPTDSLNRNLLPGTYRVEVTDAAGCTLRDSVVLTERTVLNAEVTGLPPLCEGRNGRLQLDSLNGGSGSVTVSIDDDFFLPIERIGDFRPPPGAGVATFRDADGCTLEVPFFVPGALRPSFSPLTDTTILLGDSLLLDPGVRISGLTARWSPPGSLATPDSLLTFARPERTTNYVLDLLSDDGCAFTYRIRVRVDERAPVYVPSAFSPNGDGTNDRYELLFDERVREVTTFRIFNRWGTLVHDGPAGWDGRIDGRLAPAAVYVFHATVRLANEQVRELAGEFVLYR